MNTIAVTEKLNTHKHGRDYHNRIGRIGMEIGMEYSYMNTIIRKLFDANFTYNRKILALPPREVYSFVLNNDSRLKHAVREAMAAEIAQLQLDMVAVSEFEFHIPHSDVFTYDNSLKSQVEMVKNVYQNYLSSRPQLRALHLKGNLKNSAKAVIVLNGGTKTVIKGMNIFLLFTATIQVNKSCSIPIIFSV